MSVINIFSFLVGRIEPSRVSHPLSETVVQFPNVQPGGSWAPKDCYARQVNTLI